jgi:hypothetical protein
MKLYVHTAFEPSAKKTPSLLFMLRQEYQYSVKNKYPISVKTLCFEINVSPSILELMKLYFFKTYFVAWHNFFAPIAECYANDVMMLCLCKMIFVPKIHTHSHSGIHNHFAVYFSASPLIFRCISVDFSL